LREKIGRKVDDRDLILFETAIGEIGANVLTHGRPPGVDHHVEYVLRFTDGAAVASFIDPGPPVHEHLDRQMPDAASETGRGLAMARSLLDELGYEREGKVNKWRLMKRL
jgi:serine/threonine-protein kinase RsbW